MVARYHLSAIKRALLRLFCQVPIVGGMRIAMLSWECVHSICVGGVGVHVTELAAALERKEHEVHVFTRMGPGQSHYGWIDGVHHHRCPFDLHTNFVDEVHKTMIVYCPGSVAYMLIG